MTALAAHASVIKELLETVDKSEIDVTLETAALEEARERSELVEGFHEHGEEGKVEEAHSLQSHLEQAKSAYEKLHDFVSGRDSIDEAAFESTVAPLIRDAYSSGLLALDLRKDLDSSNADIGSLLRAMELRESMRSSVANIEKNKDRYGPKYQDRLDSAKRDLARCERKIGAIEAKVKGSLGEGLSGEKEDYWTVSRALLEKVEIHYLLGELMYLTGARTEVTPVLGKRPKHCAEADYLKVVKEGVLLFEMLENDESDEGGLYCMRAVYLAGMAHHRLATLYEEQKAQAENPHLHTTALKDHKMNAIGWLNNVSLMCEEREIDIDKVLATKLGKAEYAEAIEHRKRI